MAPGAGHRAAVCRELVRSAGGRGRIDWKYLLGLELADPGFDASVLSEFRTRLVTGGAETLLLDTLLALCREHKLLVARGRQRTDSTHVLGAVRALNRLGCAIETLRGPERLGDGCTRVATHPRRPDLTGALRQAR